MAERFVIRYGWAALDENDFRRDLHGDVIVNTQKERPVSRLPLVRVRVAFAITRRSPRR